MDTFYGLKVNLTQIQLTPILLAIFASHAAQDGIQLRCLWHGFMARNEALPSK